MGLFHPFLDDEGVRMISTIVDCEVPDAVAIDMRLEASFDDITDQWTLLKFRPGCRSVSCAVAGTTWANGGRPRVDGNITG